MLFRGFFFFFVLFCFLYCVHPPTVSRLWRRFKTMVTTNDHTESGSPPVTTRRNDRLIYRQHLCEPFLTAAERDRNTSNTHKRPIHEQTVRRRLTYRDLHSRRPARGPVLTAGHRHERMRWAQERLNWWSWRQWQNVLFADESRYCAEPMIALENGDDAMTAMLPTSS